MSSNQRGSRKTPTSRPTSRVESPSRPESTSQSEGCYSPVDGLETKQAGSMSGFEDYSTGDLLLIIPPVEESASPRKSPGQTKKGQRATTKNNSHSISASNPTFGVNSINSTKSPVHSQRSPRNNPNRRALSPCNSFRNRSQNKQQQSPRHSLGGSDTSSIQGGVQPSSKHLKVEHRIQTIYRYSPQDPAPLTLIDGVFSPSIEIDDLRWLNTVTNAGQSILAGRRHAFAKVTTGEWIVPTGHFEVNHEMVQQFSQVHQMRLGREVPPVETMHEQAMVIRNFLETRDRVRGAIKTMIKATRLLKRVIVGYGLKRRKILDDAVRHWDDEEEEKRAALREVIAERFLKRRPLRHMNIENLKKRKTLLNDPAESAEYSKEKIPLDDKRLAVLHCYRRSYSRYHRQMKHWHHAHGKIVQTLRDRALNAFGSVLSVAEMIKRAGIPEQPRYRFSAGIDEFERELAVIQKGRDQEADDRTKLTVAASLNHRLSALHLSTNLPQVMIDFSTPTGRKGTASMESSGYGSTFLTNMASPLIMTTDPNGDPATTALVKMAGGEAPFKFGASRSKSINVERSINEAGTTEMLLAQYEKPYQFNQALKERFEFPEPKHEIPKHRFLKSERKVGPGQVKRYLQVMYPQPVVPQSRSPIFSVTDRPGSTLEGLGASPFLLTETVVPNLHKTPQQPQTARPTTREDEKGRQHFATIPAPPATQRQQTAGSTASTTGETRRVLFTAPATDPVGAKKQGVRLPPPSLLQTATTHSSKPTSTPRDGVMSAVITHSTPGSLKDLTLPGVPIRGQRGQYQASMSSQQEDMGWGRIQTPSSRARDNRLAVERRKIGF